MNNYSDYDNKRIDKIFNYIHWFLLSSVFFALCNILLILSFILFDINFNHLLVFFIPLIFLGPALSALCTFMYKVVYDRYVDTFRDYFHSYKENFITSLKLWIPFLIISYICIIDLKLSIASGKFLFLVLPLVFILIINILLVSYIFPIISKYKISIIDSYKLAIFLIIQKPLNALLNLAIVLICGYILIYTRSFLILFAASIAAFFLLKNMNYSFLFIENKYLKTQNNIERSSER